jgi:Na+/H+ antiporter NhaD/arsenite permease-like protein
MPVVGVLIFAVTYVLISARRLEALGFDRPAGALLGAVACVAFGALAPEQALAAVDTSTLLLLLGVMGMGAFLAVDGLFEQLEGRLVAVAKTPTRLLGLLIWGAGLLSAVITNDAVCVLGAPLVVRLILRHGLPPLPYLMALATAANTGSVATLVGNPQNMLCAQLGGLEYGDHLLLMGPVAVLGLAINHGLLLAMFRDPLRTASFSTGENQTTQAISTRAKVSLAVIFACSIAYTLGTNLAWTATGGFVLLMLVHRRDARELWPRIDWTLLLFFAGLFVVVEGLVQTGVPAAMFERYPLATGEDLRAWMRLTGIFVVGSNIVSNVPFILVIREQLASLADPRAAWELLTMASTFAGNLTLLGSVANIIVAEIGRDVGGLGFWQHLRVGVPLTLLTTSIGAAWLWLVI